MSPYKDDPRLGEEAFNSLFEMLGVRPPPEPQPMPELSILYSRCCQNIERHDNFVKLFSFNSLFEMQGEYQQQGVGVYELHFQFSIRDAQLFALPFRPSRKFAFQFSIRDATRVVKRGGEVVKKTPDFQFSIRDASTGLSHLASTRTCTFNSLFEMPGWWRVVAACGFLAPFNSLFEMP